MLVPETEDFEQLVTDVFTERGLGRKAPTVMITSDIWPATNLPDIPKKVGWASYLPGVTAGDETGSQTFGDRMTVFCPSVFVAAAAAAGFGRTDARFSRYLSAVQRLIGFLDEFDGDRIKAEDALYHKDHPGFRFISEVELRALDL